MGLGSDFDFDFVLFGKVNGSVGVSLREAWCWFGAVSCLLYSKVA